MRNIILTKNTDCSSGTVTKMNDLTYRICLSAVETKHSTALLTATGLSQEWPTRIGELVCVEAYLTISAGSKASDLIHHQRRYYDYNAAFRLPQLAVKEKR